MTKGRVRVGIGGWTYPPWRGTFYPAKLAQARELEYAASRLGAIEINGTFYGRQSPASWRKWADTVPDDFQFAVKGSRFCVTRPRLADAGEGVTSFLAQGLSQLGPKLGPILWMLPAKRKFDREDMAGFFSLLPRQVDGVSLRHVIEPAHKSFGDDSFVRLCRDHDVAIAFVDSEGSVSIDARTASFSYARLKRMQPEIVTGYPNDVIKSFADKLASDTAHARDAYVFMINGAKVRAPAAALALQDLLGIAPA